MSLSRVHPTAAAIVLLGVLMCSLVGMEAAHAKSKAPLGHKLMCLRTPSECQAGGSSVAKGGEETLRLLVRINSNVNSAIRPRDDGASDNWDASAQSGDCEDYVLAKRRALINAGLPASALRIAYVKTQTGEGHAVLVVKTTEGDFILDNLDGRVRGLAQIGYRIVSMSGANPRQWS